MIINKTLNKTGSMCPTIVSSTQNFVSETTSTSLSLAQLAERAAARFAYFARVYFNIFYRATLTREVALAGLKPGASILHIGGGAYPYTALFLARNGYRVYACDCDITAVAISKDIIAKKGLAKHITILHENGCSIDSKGYDAVWVSRTICPKDKVLEQSLASLKKGGVLVYRKLPAWLALFGKIDVAYIGAQMNKTGRARFGLSAESIVIKKTKSRTEGRKNFSF